MSATSQEEEFGDDVEGQIEMLKQHVRSNKATHAVCSGIIDAVPYITLTRKDGTPPHFPLSLPVTEPICNALISGGYCDKAPFGMGLNTVMDPNIRSTWQVDSKNITIHSASMLSELCGDSESSAVLAAIKSQLAPDATIVSSELYKLLIYEPGDFFKLHKDTQRSDEHFASLIVFLPSIYSGGELQVYHDSKEYSFAHSLNKYSERDENLHCNWVAFFTDCKHQILPLTDGYRAALSFNLTFEGSVPSIPQNPPDHTLRVYLTELFKAMKVNPECSEYESLGLLLEHDYTYSSLGHKYLKGRDLATYRSLLLLSDDFDTQLKLVSAEIADLYGGSEPDNYDADALISRAIRRLESDEDYFSAHIKQAQYTDSGSIDVPYRTKPLEQFHYYSREKIKRSGKVYFTVSPDNFEAEMKDMSTSHGYILGNEGSYYFTLSYSKVALIITPKNRMHMFGRQRTEQFTDVTIVTGSLGSDDNLQTDNSRQKKRRRNNQDHKLARSKKKHKVK